jgi:hypothetical protein
MTKESPERVMVCPVREGLKRMVSGLLFAVLIASRKLPAPESEVLVTVMTASKKGKYNPKKSSDHFFTKISCLEI